MDARNKIKGIERTPYYSYKTKTLPEGCKLCVKGKKLVLFITGVCNRTCFYCPLSDEKRNKDTVYANEWCAGESGGLLTKEQLDIIYEEAESSKAEGAGVTGGDPLLVVDRTADVIKKLKSRFGKKFHIHLYTSLENTTEEKLEKLHDAGLDEIRFHPNLSDDRLWGRIELARRYDWDVGVEIPVVPKLESETKKLLDFLDGKIDFLNLNELELADNTTSKLAEMGYKEKDELSYAVEGSEECGLRLMEHCLERGCKYKMHLCTAKLKDRVQVGMRLKRRSKNVAAKTDYVTEEGLLIRGIAYLKETAPSFSYRKMLKEMPPEKRAALLEDLKEKRARLKKELNLKEEAIRIDDYKLRLIMSKDVVEKKAQRIKTAGLVPAVVEEYPTKDGLETEIEFL